MLMFQLRYKCFNYATKLIVFLHFFTIYVFRFDVFGDVNKMFYICRREINTISKPNN